MRTLSHLSPSSLALWEKDKETFYLQQLADTKIERPKKEAYSVVGSAFDAYVKAALIEALGGEDTFEKLFESQVDQQWWDFGLKAGKYLFDCYKISGAYDALLVELRTSPSEPRFEFRVSRTIDDVTILGIPDCRYQTPEKMDVTLDWKVNGFCSNYGASPFKYFSSVHDGWGESTAPRSKTHGKAHGEYQAIQLGGIEIGAHYLEQTNKDWADQLAIYGWLLGSAVGDENTIVRIDQLVCKPRPNEYPLIRVARHGCRVSAAWQTQLWSRLHTCWEAIQTGTAYTGAQREMLELQASARAGADTDVEKWIFEASQKPFMERAR